MSGMGKAFVGHIRENGLVTASVIAAGLSLFVVVRLDPRSVFLFISLVCAAALLSYSGKRYLVNRLGGITGDAIGAISELIEVLVLFLFVIFSSGT